MAKDINKKLVEEVKECGLMLLSNAEEIAGNYKYRTNMQIVITFDECELPDIKLVHNFIPDKSIDRVKK